MSLALHYCMGDVHHSLLRAPVSEMTYTVSSGTLNSSIPYRYHTFKLLMDVNLIWPRALFVMRPCLQGRIAEWRRLSVCLSVSFFPSSQNSTEGRDNFNYGGNILHVPRACNSHSRFRAEKS